jgi:hypothetical protein
MENTEAMAGVSMAWKFTTNSELLCKMLLQHCKLMKKTANV